jgi:Zn-dependent protease with chaperone function
MIEEKQGRSLNPFAFPSETQLRSVLLIWAILSLCWGIGFFYAKGLVKNLGWPTIDKLPKLDRDILSVEEDHPSIVPSPENMSRWLQGLGSAYQELENPDEIARLQAALAGLSDAARRRLLDMVPYVFIPLGFLILSLLCILAFSFVRTRRFWFARLADPEVVERADLQGTLQDLVEEARDLQRHRGERPLRQPRFLISRGAVDDGQAYGSSRRPVVVLTRAMLSILRGDIRQYGRPYSFRATVLHELAHLANRDITRSYWAEASWIILLPVFTLLLWVLGASTAPTWFKIVISLHVLAILLVIELIRRSILRGREHDADLRTALLWNAGEPLRSSFVEGESDSGRPGTFLQRLARFWRKHPTAAERRNVLDHPNRALAISPDIPILAGLLFGNLIGGTLIVTSVIVLVTDALGVLMTESILDRITRTYGLATAIRIYYPVGSFTWSILMSVAAFALLSAASYLLAGTLGVQAQRESVLQVIQGRRTPHPYRGLLKPAFLTAAGFEAGLILLPLTPALPGKSWGFVGLILWLLFATLPFWMWLSSIRFFARRLLGTHIADRNPVKQLRILKWASTILFWPLILVLLGGQFWIWPSIRLIRGMGALAMGSVGLLGFIFLLALMLLALAVREVRREERRPQCPHCGEETEKATVADRCKACGNNLAPWLFIEAPPIAEEGVA